MVKNNTVLDNILLPTLHKTFYIGKVIDNKDDMKIGRLKISIPELTQNEQIWIKPLFKNFTPLPQIGDYVIIIRFGYSIENLFYINNSFLKIKEFENQFSQLVDQESIIKNNYQNFNYIGLIPNMYLSFYNNDNFKYNGIVMKTNNHIFMLKDTTKIGDTKSPFFRLKGNNYTIQVLNNTMQFQVKSPNIVIYGDKNLIEINQNEIQLNSKKTKVGSITETDSKNIRNIVNEELSKRKNTTTTNTSTNTLVLGSQKTNTMNTELIKNLKYDNVQMNGNNLSISQSNNLSLSSQNLKLLQSDTLDIKQKSQIFKIDDNFLQNQKSFNFVSDECFSIISNSLKIYQKESLDLNTSIQNINVTKMLINTTESDEYRIIRKSDLINIVNGYNEIINTLLDTLSNVLSVDKNTTFTNVLTQLSNLNNNIQTLGSSTIYVR